MKFLKVLVAVLFTQIACAQAQTCYGDCEIVKNSTAMSSERLSESCKAIQQNNTTVLENITITGTVEGVCQAKGCWATVKLPNGETMTIKFKDYAFFLPKDCASQKITCHGKMFMKTTSVAELKHLAEDAGKSKKEIKKIKQPKQEFRFEADGVLLS
jgi:hypothetical protein